MTTKEFFEKAAEDKTLYQKLSAARTAEDGYAVAREAGLTDDFKAFIAAMAGNELTEEELTRVAGGAAVELLPDWSWDDLLSNLSRLMSR